MRFGERKGLYLLSVFLVSTSPIVSFLGAELRSGPGGWKTDIVLICSAKDPKDEDAKTKTVMLAVVVYQD